MGDLSCTITPIGWVRSPFIEKFATPRQSGEVSEAKGVIHFHPEFANPDAFREIAAFSHLWILFQFHQATESSWKPLVRPPRLGGNKKVGVFASRSPFRPNSLGMSCVVNQGVFQDSKHGISLSISGLDIIDKTPVYDIKPYLPHSDVIIEADSGYSPEAIELEISWECEYTGSQQLLIEQTLRLDPRPGYKSSDTSKFGSRIGNENIIWSIIANHLTIHSITCVDNTKI